MVNMAHNRNYRRARHTFCRVIFNFRNFGRVFFRRQRNYFHIKFRANKLCCFKINILINGNHYAKHKQGFNNFINFAFNEICKVFNVNAFANFNAGRSYNRCLYCRLLRFTAAGAFFHHMVAAVHVAAVAACILAFNLRFFIAFFVKLLFAALLTAAVLVFKTALLLSCGITVLLGTLPGLLSFRSDKNTSLRALRTVLLIVFALLALLQITLAMLLHRLIVLFMVLVILVIIVFNLILIALFVMRRSRFITGVLRFVILLGFIFFNRFRLILNLYFNLFLGTGFISVIFCRHCLLSIVLCFLLLRSRLFFRLNRLFGKCAHYHFFGSVIHRT